MQSNIEMQQKPSNNRKKSIFRFIVAVFFVFVLIYQPPMPISTIYILTAVSWGYLFVFGGRNYAEYLGLFVAFVFMFAMMFLVISFNGARLSNISHFFWMFMCIIPSAIAFSIYTRKSSKSFEYLFHVLLCAALIQAILAYVCLFSEEIQRSFFKQMVQVGLYTKKHIAKWGYRIYGYGMSLMFAIPVVQGVLGAWSVLFGIERGKVIYSVLGVLILISAVISAKISFIVFLVTFLLGLLIGRKIYAKRFVRLLLVVAICGAILAYAYSYAESNNNQLAEWLGILFDEDRASEYYGDYFTNREKWKLPQGFDLIVGTGTTRPGYNVDMGIVNDIWVGGLLYFVFSACVVFYLGKRIKRNPLFPNMWQKICAVSLVVAFWIANVKGQAFSYSPFFAFFMVTALFSEHGHKTVDNEKQERLSCN